MPFNGVGVFTLVSGNPVITGTTISSTWANNTLQDIASGLSTTITRDGQSVVTANIPMGNNKITGLNQGSATGDALAYQQLFSQGVELDIASAATTDIGAQLTNFLRITGTTTITSLGTNYNGPRFVRFAGALTLTHDASTLILPTGANIITAAGDAAIFYPKATSGTPDGWECVSYQRATGSALVPTPPTFATTQGAFKNLQASATGTGANVSVSCDEIVLETASNTYLTARSVSLTISGASSGANGLDTGTLAASTWYSVWIISDGSTTAGLLSLSATSPTMPNGYTYKARTGWIRTDATVNKYPLGFTQRGRRIQYKVASGSNVTDWPQMASGTPGATLVAIAVGNFVPTTAASIRVLADLPNSNFLKININSENNATVGSYNAPGGGASSIAMELILESTNIYWATNASSFVRAIGWEDNL